MGGSQSSSKQQPVEAKKTYKIVIDRPAVPNNTASTTNVGNRSSQPSQQLLHSGYKDQSKWHSCPPGYKS